MDHSAVIIVLALVSSGCTYNYVSEPAGTFGLTAGAETEDDGGSVGDSDGSDGDSGTAADDDAAASSSTDSSTTGPVGPGSASVGDTGGADEGDPDTCVPGCPAHADCVEVDGVFECVCQDGWHGDGTRCVRAYGESCTGNTQCEGGLCIASDPPQGICSVPCNPAAADDCQDLGTGGFCLPLAANFEVGGCMGTIDSGPDDDDAILSVFQDVYADVGPGDLDIFTMFVDAGTSYRITVEPGVGLDVALDVYSIGEPFSSADLELAGDAEFLQFSSNADGLVHAVVTSSGGSGPYYVYAEEI